MEDWKSKCSTNWIRTENRYHEDIKKKNKAGEKKQLIHSFIDPNMFGIKYECSHGKIVYSSLIAVSLNDKNHYQAVSAVVHSWNTNSGRSPGGRQSFSPLTGQHMSVNKERNKTPHPSTFTSASPPYHESTLLIGAVQDNTESGCRYFQVKCSLLGIKK